MKILYVTTATSNKKYNEYITSKGLRNGQQAQKFNYYLVGGIKKNGEDVEVVSVRPINRNSSKQVFWKDESDTENNIKFNYVGFINFPILRNISVYFSVKKELKKLLNTNVYTRIIADGLGVSLSRAVLSVSKQKNIKNTCIVTDVPCHRPSNEKPPLSEKIALSQMRKFDSYLLLTEKMSEVVNPGCKPYVVIPGFVAKETIPLDLSEIKKYDEFVVLYAGNTCKKYGIPNLVDGFLKAEIPNSILRIYGNGDFDESLRKIALEHKNIEYLGVKDNNDVVLDEIRATVLVNPRPTNEEYTKYSFPSKNFEYMLSGTPVLTTNLPGMPGSVKPFVYIINDESAEGIKDALLLLSKKKRDELNAFGEGAKRYVSEEKNNVKQAEKLLEMVKK